MSEQKPEGLGEADAQRITQDGAMRRDEALSRAAPIADPTPVGLAAFALTTFLFSIINAGWLEQIGTFIPLAFFYGGLVQLLAGVWEFRNNNTFGALVFTSYGAFWGSLGFFFFYGESLGVLTGVGPSVGFTLVGWTIFTLYVWIASIKVNRAVFVTLTVFLFTLLLLDLGFLLAVQGLIVVGGYVGIILALCAWYTSAAGIINQTFGRTVLPLGSAFGAPQPEPAPTLSPERTTEHTGQPLPENLRHPLTDTPPFAPHPTPEPTTEVSAAEGISPITQQTTTPTATAQAGVTEQTPETQPAKEMQQGTEEIVAAQDTHETTESTQEDTRRSIGSSAVGDEEALQSGTRAAPESQAGAQELPIKDYDSLNVAQITNRLSGLSIEEIERLQKYEAETKDRRLLTERFEKRIRTIRQAGTT